MKTQITLAAATIALATFAYASSAQAQTYGFTPLLSQSQPQSETIVAGGMPYGYHASTAAEGYMRGYADVVRSYGLADLYHSQAANYWEAARAADIQNDYDYAQTYFAMREVNREARAAEAGPRVTRFEAEQVSQSRMPTRLSREYYEPVVGQLYWPAALQEEQFNDTRGRINELMTARWSGEAVEGSIGELATSMEAQLNANVREFSSHEYLTAKRFLESLRYEMTLPADPAGTLASAE